MTLAEYKEAVEAGITGWFDSELERAPSSESRLLLERMHTLIKRGGKRARPELLYITYTAYGGKEPADIVDLGLALEFHHQFLLIHDDFMDQDTVRYDGPNILGYYLQDLSGHPDIAASMALLAGDLLFSYANHVVLRSKTLTADKKVSLLDQINATNADVAFGQQLDLFNVDGLLDQVNERRLLQTHLLKTASYTTQYPMVCAAITLGLPPPERQKILRFGERFGLLFQLTDDYSDYFDNDSAFNERTRPKFRDYPQGKLTLPVILGLKLADKAQTHIIRRNLGNKQVSESEMRQVVQVLIDCGAEAAARDQIAPYQEEAIKALDKLSLDDDRKQLFRAMLDKYRI